MFGRKSSNSEATYIGSVLTTMSQAVFATAEYGTKPEGTWRQLTSLLYGVMHRRGWYPDAPNLEIKSVSELIQSQTQNRYGVMALGDTWRLYGGVPLSPDSHEIVKDALLDLGDFPQSVAIPTFMNELAPIMGKSDSSVLSFAQKTPLVHAAFTMVTVFDDTTHVSGREQQHRRELAAGLEADFIGGWAVAEKIAVATGRDMGDPHASDYLPWW